MPDQTTIGLNGSRESAPTSRTSGDETLSAASSANRIGFRDFLRLLNRRKWQLACTTILVCCVAGLILAFLTPEYRATALVMLDTRKAKVTNTTDVIGGLTADVIAVQTEIEVLKSTALLGRVVDKLNLASDPEFGAPSSSSVQKVLRKGWSLLTDWTGSGGGSRIGEGSLDDSQRARAIVRLARDLIVTPRGPAPSLRPQDFLWCPRHVGTPRQFECTRLITVEHVKSVIDRVPAFVKLNKRVGEAPSRQGRNS